MLASLMSVVMFFAAVGPSIVSAEEVKKSEFSTVVDLEAPSYDEISDLSDEEIEIIAENSESSTVEELSDYYGEDLQDINISNFEQDFESLVNDPVFNGMEEIMAIQEAEAELTHGEVKAQWIPVVAAALRVLVKKVGKKGMQKGWAVARPHVEKALKNMNSYIIDGPSGGKIIQVRNKKTKQPIFRLDYHYIDGKGPYLHYHVAPNMKTHHYL